MNGRIQGYVPEPRIQIIEEDVKLAVQVVY